MENEKTVYPISTKLTSNYSILSLAFRHKIDGSNVGDWRKKVKKLNWEAHDFYRGTGPRSGVWAEAKQGINSFLPHIIFTEEARENFLGLSGPPAKKRTTDEVLNEVFGANGRDQKSQNQVMKDNVILSLKPDSENGLGQPLKLQVEPSLELIFSVDWADCWLFACGLGILSFKVVLNEVTLDGVAQTPTVDNLNVLNRHLRFFQPGAVKVTVSGQSDPVGFWNDIIAAKWLGASKQKTMNLTAGTEDGESIFPSCFDRKARYAKLLTMANVPNLDDPEEDSTGLNRLEYNLNAPVTDPPLNFDDYFNEISKGERLDVAAAYHFATMEGYPTYGDYLLYDIATCGNAGDAMGLTGVDQWKVSPEYLKQIFSESAIEIWEYWRGLALHESLAFLSFHSDMPIMHQAETHYYPLYIYHYFMKIRLGGFSATIVDRELNDVIKARQIHDEFNKFRNQYWFSSVTIDFQGVEITNQIKSGMKLDNLYEVVSNEVSDISEFISDKLDKGKQSLLAFIVLAFYPISLLLDVSGFNGYMQRLGEEHRLLALGLIVFGVVLAAVVSFVFMSRFNSLVFRLYERFYRSLL